MKSFKQFVKEDGCACAAGAPTNNVGGGAVAGTGGKGGEPGVDMRKRRKSPILFKIKRK